ncbi:HYR-like domain-containing protein, partial [Flavobacterium selenitireducens]|uniref:HYR-like domain-containing protein n=1 Tax=Flavobacterium selenitireducens TaxID=2722704 RepID=UPI00168A719A
GTNATASGLTAGTYTVTVTDANSCSLTQSFTITEPTPLSAVASQVSTATCIESADGQAEVLAAGGTAPYTYLWDNGVTTVANNMLSVGTHNIIATDANGCTYTASVVIGFSDTVAPVPTLAALPNITAECAVVASDIPVPSATDNCAGLISVTNNATFPITAQGTTVITWTYTDINGNTATQTQNVVIDDVSAPVPQITSLPTISMQCAVLVTDIPVPTAIDNCAGSISATTVDTLVYQAVGTYSILWQYDDGNGNVSTQTQMVEVTESAIASATFASQEVVYNTQPQSISVANLPEGASVSYSIVPETGLGNAAVNTGVYTITAAITPASDAPNCGPITLTATLTIVRAPQQIVFDALPVKHLENDPDFQLTATATSGLAVHYTYSYTSTNVPATVSATGWVDMLTSGTVQITAHQDGNANYLPAETVVQPLTIISSDASIHSVNIGGTTYANPSSEIYYLMECNNTDDAVAVSLTTEANAEANPGHEFTIATPRPGIYSQSVFLTSQDGTGTSQYTIVIEKRFNFFDIVEQKFDNVLLANNNPATNGGYSFAEYEWYKNDVLVSRNQYLSAGPTQNDLLDPEAEYHLKLTTIEGDVLQTCMGRITREHDYSMSVFPNPSRWGQQINVVVDFPSEEIQDMQIEVFDLTGRKVYGMASSERKTALQLPGSVQAATYIVKCTTSRRQKTFKIILNR